MDQCERGDRSFKITRTVVRVRGVAVRLMFPLSFGEAFVVLPEELRDRVVMGRIASGATRSGPGEGATNLPLAADLSRGPELGFFSMVGLAARDQAKLTRKARGEKGAKSSRMEWCVGGCVTVLD